jgi:hypothetical protein
MGAISLQWKHRKKDFRFVIGNMLNFSVYLPEFRWIGGKFPHNHSYAASPGWGMAENSFVGDQG